MGTPAEELLRACACGDLARVRMCVSGGIDPNRRSVDWNGCASLHVASQFGWPKLVRFLLENGADVTRRTWDDELVEWAKIAEAEDTALHLAAAEGHTETCRVLIEHGAEVDAVNSHGSTPMSNAIEASSVDIVTMLLGNGARLDEPTATGVPPLHKAAIDGQLRIVRALILAGAEPNATDHTGRTALHSAVEHEYILVCCELAAAGGPVDALDDDGVSPASMASAAGSDWFGRLVLPLARSDQDDDRR